MRSPLRTLVSLATTATVVGFGTAPLCTASRTAQSRVAVHVGMDHKVGSSWHGHQSIIGDNLGPEHTTRERKDSLLIGSHTTWKNPSADSGANGASSNRNSADDGIRSVIDSVAQDWLCPITRELPLDPVTAEDGQIYERSAIMDHMRRQSSAIPQIPLRSPVTNEPMGPTLTRCVQARNTIEKLVRSGVISGDKADAWQKQLAVGVEVKATQAKAEAGDASLGKATGGKSKATGGKSKAAVQQVGIDHNVGQSWHGHQSIIGDNLGVQHTSDRERKDSLVHGPHTTWKKPSAD